VKKKVVFKII